MTTKYHFIVTYACRDGAAGSLDGIECLPAGSTETSAYLSVRSRVARVIGTNDFAITFYRLVKDEL